MENNLDKLFKSKLGGQEPEFDPAAWDRMEGLLDDSGMIPEPKKKSKKRMFFFLFLLFFGVSVSVIGFMSKESSNSYGEGSTLVDNAIESKNISDLKLENNTKTSKGTSKKISEKSNSSKGLENEINLTNSFGNLPESQTAVLENNIKNNKSITPENEKYIELELENTFKNTQPKPQFQSIDNVISSQNNAYRASSPNEQPHNQESLESEGESNAIAKLSNEVMNEEILIGDNKSQVDVLIDKEKRTNLKDMIPFLDFLNTKTSSLYSLPSLVSPQIQTYESSIFTFGIMTSARLNEGFGYSVGPYISFNVGKGYSLSLGGQFDSQDFDAGPQISVIDKVYSFGSRLSERQFSLTNQKSVRIPFTISKSFNRFSLTTGAIFNRILISQGSISNLVDGGNEENVIIDSDMINPTAISLQLGASIGVSRHIEIDFGLEYKTKAFVTDFSTSNNSNIYYPTLGLRYKLFKF